jgi:hypothetical protein
MGEGGAKQALVDLGSLPNQLLHGFSLPPGPFGQSLERYTVVLGLVPQGLWRGLEQASDKLESLFLELKGVLYGCLVGCLGGFENLLKILLLPLTVHHVCRLLLLLLPLPYAGQRLSISMVAPCEAWCIPHKGGLPLRRFCTHSYNDAYGTFPLHVVSQILCLGLQHPKSISHAHAHLAPNEPLQVHPAHS